MRGVPIVSGVFDECQAQIGFVRTKRQHEAIRITRVRLMKHILAGGEFYGAGIAEATHAAQRSKIMIEGAIFLHQENHVFHILNAAGAVIGGDSQSARDACGKCSRSCGSG